MNGLGFGQNQRAAQNRGLGASGRSEWIASIFAAPKNSRIRHEANLLPLPVYTPATSRDRRCCRVSYFDAELAVGKSRTTEGSQRIPFLSAPIKRLTPLRF